MGYGRPLPVGQSLHLVIDKLPLTFAMNIPEATVELAKHSCLNIKVASRIIIYYIYIIDCADNAMLLKVMGLGS